MTVEEIAQRFTEYCRKGEDEKAGAEFWADDVVSIEAQPGEMSHLQGPEAIRGKHDWWWANFEVHDATVEGPFVNGDQFAIRFVLDCTHKESGQRTVMTEIAVYTVRNGKVAEERFFADPADCQ